MIVYYVIFSIYSDLKFCFLLLIDLKKKKRQLRMKMVSKHFYYYCFVVTPNSARAHKHTQWDKKIFDFE